LGKKVTDSNLIEEEIKRRLNSGNACYHSVQNLLSSSLLSKNVKTRIYKIHLPWFCMGVLVSDIKGGTQTEGVCEQGAEEDIWTEEG
jgi:hypothetical protein